MDNTSNYIVNEKGEIKYSFFLQQFNDAKDKILKTICDKLFTLEPNEQRELLGFDDER